MFNDEDEIPKKIFPSRTKIHSEIEEILIKKLFTVVENIQTLPTGELDFNPYDDRMLIQLEAFLDKKFKEKVFNRRKDTNVVAFLEQLKIERARRDFRSI